MNGCFRAMSLLSLSAVVIAGGGCNGVKTDSPPASTAFRTPIPPPPEVIEKPANISFSTYSKEWPVGWQWVDPDEANVPTPYNTRKGVLRVTIPTGKNLVAENLTAPRYLKSIKGNFQIETRVAFNPIANYQGAGLLIFKDAQNYMRFERAFGGVGGGGSGLRVDTRIGDRYEPLLTPDDLKTDLREVDLKVVRTGRSFYAYWRENEEFEWREIAEFVSDYPETVLAGLVMCNTARELTAEFAYIRLEPAVGR